MKEITPQSLLSAAIELAKGVTAVNRFDALLSTVRKVIQCDAVVVLSYQNGCLTPLAQQGLMAEVLGRRFELSDNPRLAQICQSSHVVRFDSNCDLPDPYDSLVMGHQGHLPIHACMGFPLFFEQQLLGVLTLDSLEPGAFDQIDGQALDVVSAMAAVSLHSALTIAKLEQNVVNSNNLVNELSQYRGQVHAAELVGNSTVMQELKRAINLVAPADYTVLIQGQSGTGKELVANQLHLQSSRRDRPMIYLNCAALPENLIESELFGHVKGAYTGADKARLGKFKLANNSTLFLDEIGELPLTAQSKLLRVLQQSEIQPVGQDQVEQVNVRVIAATNRDLKAEVEKGHFREDLYHRLNVFPIQVPSLSLRFGDIALLTGFFAEKMKRKLGVSQIKTSPELLAKLEQYDWPGNVRELEHVLTRTALSAMARTKDNAVLLLEPQDCMQLTAKTTQTQDMAPQLEAESTAEPEQPLPLKQQVDEFQRQKVKQALIQAKGNWSKAAQHLALDRANLTRLAKRLGIRVNKVIE